MNIVNNFTSIIKKSIASAAGNTFITFQSETALSVPRGILTGLSYGIGKSATTAILDRIVIPQNLSEPDQKMYQVFKAALTGVLVTTSLYYGCGVAYTAPEAFGFTLGNIFFDLASLNLL